MEGGRGKWQECRAAKRAEMRVGDRWVGGIEAKMAGQEKHKVLAYLQCCPGLAVEATETAVAKQCGHMLFCLMTASLLPNDCIT